MALASKASNTTPATKEKPSERQFGGLFSWRVTKLIGLSVSRHEKRPYSARDEQNAFPL